MIELPASKSIGARFLVASYFAGTLPADPVFDDCDDLKVLQRALLGLYSDEQPIDYGETPLDVNASGTALRLLTAVCASTPGADFVVTGIPRLMQRPMAPLIEALRSVGAKITSQGSNGNGPYRVTGKQLDGGDLSIDANISSQFISALMMAAPTWDKGMKLSFTTTLRSAPYVAMTAKMMEVFGIKVNLTDKFVEVPHAAYIAPPLFDVEADWSAATFFLEAAVLGNLNIEIAGLLPPSISWQGDSHAVEIFKKLGVKTDFPLGKAIFQKGFKTDIKHLSFDMSDHPDMVPALVVTCALEEISFTFTGVANLRHKESDRLEALRQELLKLGYVPDIQDDAICWNGEKKSIEPLPVDPHNDHRIAMALAMAALKTGKISILNPDVVEKSFTRFWEQLSYLGLKCERKENIMTVTA